MINLQHPNKRCSAWRVFRRWTKSGREELPVPLDSFFPELPGREELPVPLDSFSVSEEPFLSTVDQPARRLRVILPKCAQAAQVTGADLPRVFDFKSVEPDGAIQDEVDLIPGLSLPVAQLVFSRCVVAPGS